MSTCNQSLHQLLPISIPSKPSSVTRQVTRGGHYYVYTRIDSNWFKFDDHLVTLVSKREVFEGHFGGPEKFSDDEDEEEEEVPSTDKTKETSDGRRGPRGCR